MDNSDSSLRPGSQNTGIAFGSRCKEKGVRPSMGTVDNAYDNAMAKSFFASQECELINRRSGKTQAEAKTALFTWIEGWYNPRRRHFSDSLRLFERSALRARSELRNAAGLPAIPGKPGKERSGARPTGLRPAACPHAA